MPLPLAPLLIVSHDALLVAVQLQPVPAVIPTVPAPPDELKFEVVGEIVNVHGAPAWVTVKVCPPIVIVPVRDVVPVLAATLYATVPLPLPVAPLVIVIHDALLVAVQLQLAPLVTPTVPVVAADDVRFDAVGEIANVQGVAPACVTVKVCPPIVIVPVRELVPVLAATL